MVAPNRAKTELSKGQKHALLMEQRFAEDTKPVREAKRKGAYKRKPVEELLGAHATQEANTMPSTAGAPPPHAPSTPPEPPTQSPATDSSAPAEGAGPARVVRTYGGRLQPVVCDLPGFVKDRPRDGESGLWMRVWYDVHNRYGVLRKQEALVGVQDVQEHDRFYSLFVKRIEWNLTDFEGEPLPQPSVEDLTAFRLLWDTSEDLFYWVVVQGYQRAKELYVGADFLAG